MTNRTQETRSGPSRRQVLQAGVGGAVVAGLGGLAGQARASGSTPSGPYYPLNDSKAFLLRRITQGFSIPGLKEVNQLGYQAFLDQQLDYQNLDDSYVEGILNSEFQTLHLKPERLWFDYLVQNNQFVPMLELKAAMVFRATYSTRQLHERMVEFWTDHFNIAHQKSHVYKTTDDRDVIRAHALGNFYDLLDASGHSPAMLYYLDADTNVVGSPQENYARELMELHTLGVDGPFDENDVQEVARCLTGWSSQNSPFFGGKFGFWGGNHDYGQKVVLGKLIPAGGGKSDGEKVLRRLRSRRATSQFIAEKMTKWLLSYQPPKSLVNAVAATFRQTNGDIQAMIRVILDEGTVAALRPWTTPKLKRPFHFAISLSRAMFAISDPAPYPYQRGSGVDAYLYTMGQQPFEHPAPDGYPDTLDKWGSSLLPRWSFASAFTGYQVAWTYPDWTRIQNLTGVFNRNRLADDVNVILTGGTMANRDVQAIRDFVAQGTTQDWLSGRTITEAYALGASSPSFQYY